MSHNHGQKAYPNTPLVSEDKKVWKHQTKERLTETSEYKRKQITGSHTYLHGSSLDLVTPTDETKMSLDNDRGSTDTRFLTPSQSSTTNDIDLSELKAISKYI